MQSALLNSYRPHAPLASDTFVPFEPRAYLREYYSHLGNENRALLHFLDEAYARIFTEMSAARMLEFGGGPTIYQLISAAKYAVSIDFSEYLDANLNEVQLWLRDAHGQFFWDSFIRYVLDREGTHLSPGAVAQRRQLICSKIERLIASHHVRVAYFGQRLHVRGDDLLAVRQHRLESCSQTTDENGGGKLIKAIRHFSAANASASGSP
jgi:hypothetical protein